jgi:transcriptional regulator with XRE-family HTH domain
MARDHIALGAALRQERIANGITQKEMAARMRVTGGFLCDLEHGRRKWLFRHIEAYEKALK